MTETQVKILREMGIQLNHELSISQTYWTKQRIKHLRSAITNFEKACTLMGAPEVLDEN